MTGAAAIERAMGKDIEYNCYDNTNIHYIVCKSAEEFPGGAEAAKDLGLVPGQFYKYVCKDLGYEDAEIDDYVCLRSFQAVGKDTVWKGDWAKDSEKWETKFTDEAKEEQENWEEKFPTWFEDGKFFLGPEELEKYFSSSVSCNIVPKASNK